MKRTASEPLWGAEVRALSTNQGSVRSRERPSPQRQHQTPPANRLVATGHQGAEPNLQDPLASESSTRQTHKGRSRPAVAESRPSGAQNNTSYVNPRHAKSALGAGRPRSATSCWDAQNILFQPGQSGHTIWSGVTAAAETPVGVSPVDLSSARSAGSHTKVPIWRASRCTRLVVRARRSVCPRQTPSADFPLLVAALAIDRF